MKHDLDLAIRKHFPVSLIVAYPLGWISESAIVPTRSYSTKNFVWLERFLPLPTMENIVEVLELYNELQPQHIAGNEFALD